MASSGELPSRPRYTRGETDPLALTLFGLLRNRCLVDRRHVFQALAARGGRAASGRVQLCLNALRVCMADIERPPSQRDYVAWRARQPVPEEWPAEKFVRNCFKGWTRALEGLGTSPTADVLAARLLAQGRRLSRGELVLLLQRCAKELGVTRLSSTRFDAWAEEQGSGISKHWTFLRHFSSWCAACREAGLRCGRGGSCCDPRQRSAGMASHGEGSANPGGAQTNAAWEPRCTDTYTDEDVFEHLRAAAALTSRELRRADFSRYRRTRLADAGLAGAPLHIPSAVAVTSRFGSFPLALHAAGIISEERARLSTRRNDRDIPDDELLFYVAVGVSAQLDGRLGVRRFGSWRMEVKKTWDVAAWPPDEDRIRRQLGPDWPGVVVAAVDAHPECLLPEGPS